MKKTKGATVKYRMYGKIDFEKKFETIKEARGFYFGYVVKTPNITGELIINEINPNASIAWGLASSRTL